MTNNKIYRDKTDTPQLGKFQTYILTSSPKRVSIVSAIIFSLVMFASLDVTILLADNYRHIFETSAVVFGGTLVTTLAWYLMYLKLYKYQQQRIVDELGLTLTNDDRVALALWYKHGVKPTSQRLGPHLVRYVDYMDSLATGRKGVYTPTMRTILLVMDGLLVTNGIVSLVVERSDFPLHLLNTLLFGFGFVMVYITGTGKKSRLLMLLNKRRIRKFAAMRQQLT